MVFSLIFMEHDWKDFSESSSFIVILFIPSAVELTQDSNDLSESMFSPSFTSIVIVGSDS